MGDLTKPVQDMSLAEASDELVRIVSIPIQDRNLDRDVPRLRALGERLQDIEVAIVKAGRRLGMGTEPVSVGGAIKLERRG